MFIRIGWFVFEYKSQWLKTKKDRYSRCGYNRGHSGVQSDRCSATILTMLPQEIREHGESHTSSYCFLPEGTRVSSPRISLAELVT